jgi:hypothetical protein
MIWKLHQIDEFLRSFGFSKGVVNPNLYYYIVGDESLILMTYSGSRVVRYKQASTYDFEMKESRYDALLLGKKSIIEDCWPLTRF